MASVGVLADGDAKVQVDGSVDASAHNYEWTVTNLHESPIVSVEVEHFRGDTCVQPSDWDQTFTNKHSIDGSTGLCGGKAPTNRGIRKGRSKKFQMRIGQMGAPVGQGPMTITFADGSTVTIMTTVSIPPSVLERYATLFGMGGLVLIVVLFKLIKGAVGGRRVTATETPDA